MIDIETFDQATGIKCQIYIYLIILYSVFMYALLFLRVLVDV
jgi:hypothetical protein